MAVQDKPTLKGYFADGKVPNEAKYIDLIDTMGVGDMEKADYDSNDDGVVDAADAAPWSGITGKPSTYPPSSHTHSQYFDKNYSISSLYGASFVGGLSVGNITGSPTAGILYAEKLWLYGTEFGDIYLDASRMRLAQNSPAAISEVYTPKRLRGDGGSERFL